MNQAFIFDLDGTLYPRDSEFYRIMSARIRQWFKEQLAIHDEDMDAYYEWMRRTYPNPFDAIDSLGLSVITYHVNVFDELKPEKYFMEDLVLREALESLSGAKFVVTQSSHGHAVRMLKALGVYHCFSDIYVRNVNWHTSKKLDAYDAIVLKYGLEPKTTIVVGDNPVIDLQAALAAGYRCIAISDHPVAGMQIVRSVPEILTLTPESVFKSMDHDEGNPN